MTDLKQQVANIFIDKGRLHWVMDASPDSNFFQIMATSYMSTGMARIQKIFLPFSAYELSLRGSSRA